MQGLAEVQAAALLQGFIPTTTHRQWINLFHETNDHPDWKFFQSIPEDQTPPKPDLVLGKEIESLNFDVGQLLDARDPFGGWYQARILQYKQMPTGRFTATHDSKRIGNIAYVEIGYVGWGSKWNEWICIDSLIPRLAPLHKFSTTNGDKAKWIDRYVKIWQPRQVGEPKWVFGRMIQVFDNPQPTVLYWNGQCYEHAMYLAELGDIEFLPNPCPKNCPCQHIQIGSGVAQRTMLNLFARMPPMNSIEYHAYTLCLHTFIRHGFLNAITNAEFTFGEKVYENSSAFEILMTLPAQFGCFQCPSSLSRSMKTLTTNNFRRLVQKFTWDILNRPIDRELGYNFLHFLTYPEPFQSEHFFLNAWTFLEEFCHYNGEQVNLLKLNFQRERAIDIAKKFPPSADRNHFYWHLWIDRLATLTQKSVDYQHDVQCTCHELLSEKMSKEVTKIIVCYAAL